MAQSIVFLQLQYRKVRCPRYGIRIEHHNFVGPYDRVTKRIAEYIFGLCQVMSVTDVAKHLQLSWDQVKRIDKLELKKRHKKPNTKGLKILCVDDISIRKHHHYLTIIANYLTGQLIGVVKDRDYEALRKFLKDQLPVKVRNNIKAVAIDMWDPYIIKAVKEQCPKALIVFDAFHVITGFSRVIDNIRNIEYRKANSKTKKLIKGSRFLLLKNPQNLKPEEKTTIKTDYQAE